MKTKNSHGLLQLGWEALAYCQCASALISGNKALFVSVDLIGEKNQVILEFLNILRLSQSSIDTGSALAGLCATNGKMKRKAPAMFNTAGFCFKIQLQLSRLL